MFRTLLSGHVRQESPKFPALTAAALLAAFSTMSASGAAWAEDAPTPAETTEAASPQAASSPKTAEAPESAAEELSQEELSELTAALSADAAARTPSSPSEANGSTNPVAAALANFNPDIAVILDVAGGWYSGEGKAVTAGGHDPQKSGFTLQQLELSLGKAVDPYFRFDANIVFSQFGVEVEEAYATTLGLPASLQLRIGQFLTRAGRLNATHPHTWEFIDQNFALTRVFGGEGNRGLGAELSWLTPLPWYAEIVLSATDAAGASTARSFLGGGDYDLDSPLDFQLTAALKQFFPLTDSLSLNWGLTAITGPNATGNGNRTDIYGMDLYLRWRPVSGQTLRWVALQGEVFWRRRQIPGDLLQDVNAYLQGIWRFADRWSAALRYEWGSPSWDGDGKISLRDPLDPTWTGHRHRASAAVTFHPSEFSRFRLQAARDDAPMTADPVWSVFLAAEFSVGAHGAHTF